MESMEQEKTTLISDIEADARREAEGILKDAEVQAAEKRKYAEKQSESLLADARRQAREQAEAVQRKAISAVELEVKRRSMQVRSAVMREITSRVEKTLAARIGSPDYQSVLIQWIAEAAVGLGAEAAEVNATEPERTLIDKKVLAAAGEAAQAQTGRPVVLTLSTARPLGGQGVVLTAADGRTAFNNQVKTRLLRRQRQIRELIYDTLFADNRRE